MLVLRRMIFRVRSGEYGKPPRNGVFAFWFIACTALLCLARASDGRQRDEATIRAKVLTAENLVLDASKQSIGIFSTPQRADGKPTACLRLSDVKGSSSMELGLYDKGSPAISFGREVAGKKGKMLIQLENSGFPSLDLENPVRQDRLSLSVEKDVISRLYLIGGGRSRLSMVGAGRNDDNMAVGLSGTKKGPRIVLGTNRGGAQLCFYDGDAHAMSRLHSPGEFSPRLEWYDREGRTLLEILFDAREEPSVLFTDSATRATKRLE